MKNTSFSSSFFISFFVALIVTSEAYSSDIFRLKNQNLNAEQVKAISVFFKKTSDLLPDSLREKLPNQIDVSFEVFKESENLASLPKDKCNSSSGLIYGKTSLLPRNQIKLNSLLLNEIVKGEENSTSFECSHKNYYRVALATLLHETAHVYDHHKIGRTEISGDQGFFKLSDWKKSLVFFKNSKNKSQKRSLDPYEFKSLDEHYAVNFEWFILDSEYKCKRPSYYRYFADHFKSSPYENVNCKINTLVRLDDNKALINIAPERVYRVDYLLASKGDEMMSGFGHSMYRLVVCAPFRKIASADCLRDKLYHVVLSYRANITDIKSNPIKGLVGKYDSVLYMLSFPKVMEEYNMMELRDLYSIPLNLTADQKTRFINKTLETYWEYAGSYKFLSQNCASESAELIQGALNDHPIINDSVVKPYSLVELLEKHKLAPKDSIKNMDEAIKKGFVFESDSKRLEEIKTRLFGEEESDYKIYKSQDPVTGEDIVRKKKKHIKDILETMSPERFEKALEQIMSEEQNIEARNRYNDLSIIVQSALNISQHELDEKIGDYLEQVENDPGPIGESVRNWNLKRKNFRLSPLKDDYGIPLVISDEDFATYKNSIEELEKTEMDLVNAVKEIYKGSVDHLFALKKVIAEARAKSKIINMTIYLEK